MSDSTFITACFILLECCANDNVVKMIAVFSFYQVSNKVTFSTICRPGNMFVSGSIVACSYIYLTLFDGLLLS